MGGGLREGSIANVVEICDDWGRIESPLAGWFLLRVDPEEVYIHPSVALTLNRQRAPDGTTISFTDLFGTEVLAIEVDESLTLQGLRQMLADRQPGVAGAVLMTPSGH